MAYFATNVRKQQLGDVLRIRWDMRSDHAIGQDEGGIDVFYQQEFWFDLLIPPSVDTQVEFNGLLRNAAQSQIEPKVDTANRLHTHAARIDSAISGYRYPAAG